MAAVFLYYILISPNMSIFLYWSNRKICCQQYLQMAFQISKQLKHFQLSYRPLKWRTMGHFFTLLLISPNFSRFLYLSNKKICRGWWLHIMCKISKGLSGKQQSYRTLKKSNMATILRTIWLIAHDLSTARYF